MMGEKQHPVPQVTIGLVVTREDLRPVYHTRDDRIRSYVLLCWLDLLLARVAEIELGITWDAIRAEMTTRCSMWSWINKGTN